MDADHAAPPPSVWRWLGLAAVSLLLLSVATIAVISTGALDPGPAGTPVAVYSPGLLEVAAGSQEVAWSSAAPAGPLAARLTAAHAAGELDSGYGLLLGDADAYLVAAVSPLGYVALWQEQGAGRSEILPWQRWPHVERNGSPNEIQVSVAGSAVTVRVNRELLWEGTVSLQATTAGVYLQSFGGPATVDFQRLSLYGLSGAE